MMPTELIKSIQPFAIALTIGLMIGVERERSHPIGQQPLGLRTFVLFSLLGAIVARLNQSAVGFAITIFVGAVVIAGYLKSSKITAKKIDIGFTTEVAAVVTYGIGFLANTEPFIALLAGLIVLVILLARSKLHTFSRIQLRAEEFQATVILLVLGIGIIPFLPDIPIDPWHLIIPQRFGLLVLIIAMLQFIGYIGIRIFGAQKGILLSGFLAGLVSSTAATATLSMQANKGEAPPLAAAVAIVLSTIAMLIKILLVVGLVSSHLVLIAGLPSLACVLIFGLFCWIIAKFLSQVDHFPMPNNPLKLFSAIKLALLLAAMIIIVTLVQRYFGQAYVLLVVFLSGLFDVQSSTLAVTILYTNHHATMGQALDNFGVAILASFVSKYFIVLTVNREKTFLKFLIPTLSAMVAIYSTAWISVNYVLKI